MAAIIRSAAMLVLIIATVGCATLLQDVDPPRISVDSFTLLPAEQGAPRFEIKLRVANPNTQPLDIAGVAYGVEVMGRELVAGVTNEVPIIEGYSEEVITLNAGLQLFEFLRFVAALGTSTGEMLDYKFSAKVDFNGFVPTQRIEDVGEISLN